ncbi:P2Y purinoceptor 8-like [Chanos chanos]|uniref:P2Y purinoceptor 8-like n=1 Tax=Chanos chanos TaxID=29144 RepID=A0A6J2WLB2_CHACN|nr:P2Y purinoceptor 8-like [Chanos chanos]
MTAGNISHPDSFSHRHDNSTCPVCPFSEASVFYLVLGSTDLALGLPSGFWALWLLGQGSRAVLESEFFIVHLLVTDMFSMLVTLLSMFHFLLWCNPTVEKVIYVLYILFLYGRPFFQSCVCVERYFAVVHPVLYLSYKSLKYRLTALLTTWVVVLTFSVGNMVVLSANVLPCVFLLALCVTSFCSLSILRVLRRQGPGDDQRRRSSVIKRKAFVIVLLIQLMLLVNYLPMLCLMPLQAFVRAEVFTCYIYPMAMSLSMVGAFVQSLLYVHRAGKLVCSTAGPKQH